MSNQETPKPRRVRIQNEGGPGYVTKITDADTGEFINNLFHARIVDLDVNNVPRAILWAHMPAIDIIAHAKVFEICPYCKQQKPEPSQNGDEYRLKTTINDTDLDLSIAKLQELQKWQRATSPSNNIYPAEALWAFMEWYVEHKGIGTIDPQETINGPDEAIEIARLVDTFCKAQGWHFDQEYYNDVIKQIKANYPE
jgi:hypothetical protein